MTIKQTLPRDADLALAPVAPSTTAAAVRGEARGARTDRTDAYVRTFGTVRTSQTSQSSLPSAPTAPAVRSAGSTDTATQAEQADLEDLFRFLDELAADEPTPAAAPEPMALVHVNETEVPRALDGHPAVDAPEADEPSAADRLFGAHTEAPIFFYLAGPAGCGKTFLARQLAEEIDGCELVATTGIAAINLGGTTINSLLGYFDTKSLQEKYVQGVLRGTLGRLWRAGVKQLILDEVSMLDGDQLTYLVRAIEEVNTKEYVLSSKIEREHAEQYGVPRMRLLLVGDFAQLPPVKAPFAFESVEWPANFAGPGKTLTLTEVRRQADADFIRALRAARLGEAGAVVDFFGAGLQPTTDDAFEGVTLMAKNESVDRYNQLRLDKLAGGYLRFESRRSGDQRSEWGKPTDPPAKWGIPPTCLVKQGALVMILANRR